MKPNSQSRALRGWAGGVVLVAALTRLALWGFYQPVPFGDTGSYRRLATSILNGWQRYDGTRTPGYPGFLALVGDDQRIWLAQMGLGMAITLLFFFLGYQVSGRAWFGGAMALAHNFNLGQLFFEANLLTETLATFWVTLATAGVFAWLKPPGRRSLLLAAGIGVAASLAWLTRPQFIFLPFWLALFVALSVQGRRVKMHWLRAAAVLLPALILLGVWVNFIHTRFRMLGLSTMTGYNLVQHTGSYFEYLPDEYAALRDTYLEYRAAHLARYGTQTNTIWEAIPAMQQASGMSFYQLSRTLTALSMQLIRQHPDLYLRNVASGWWLFWRAPVYWSPQALRWPALSSPLGVLVLSERLTLVAANLVFVISSLAAVFSARLRRVWRLTPALWCLAGTIWLTALLQTLIDHGDNPRFLVPLQSLVVLWVAWIGLSTFRAWRTGGPPEAQPA